MGKSLNLKVGNEFSSYRIKKIISMVNIQDDEIFIFKAYTIVDYISASRFIKKEYIRSGIKKESDKGFICNKMLVNTGSSLFIAQRCGTIIGTISIIADTDLGIPCRELFKDDVDAIISEQDKAYEIGTLSTTCLCKDNSIVFNMYFHAFIHCVLSKNIDIIFIQVQEKHAKFYTNNLFFKRASETKSHPEYNNINAVLLSIDVKGFKKMLTTNSCFFFGIGRMLHALNMRNMVNQVLKDKASLATSSLSNDDKSVYRFLCEID